MPTSDKTHAVTVIAAAALAVHRFVAPSGNYATSSADVLGVSEITVDAGRACSCVTHYSALVEAADTLAPDDWVKPAGDGSGRAALGSAADACGRAVGSAAAGQLVEVRLMLQQRAAPGVLPRLYEHRDRRIAAIQAGAAAAIASSRPRPGQTVKYATPAGAGLKNGNDWANAYDLAALNTAVGGTANLYVYLMGVFEPASVSTTYPIIYVKQSGTTLDLGTYGAVVRAYSGLTWTASGVNGEYYATVLNYSAFIRVTEDGLNMPGVNMDSARSNCTSNNVAGKTFSLVPYRPIINGDPIVALSNTSGLVTSTAYYAANVSNSGNNYTFQLATDQELTTIVSPTGSDNDYAGKAFWITALGRHGDPMPGSLAPGQMAYSPLNSRVYIKPSSGSAADHEYLVSQSSVGSGIMVASGVNGTPVNNVQIIGGEVYGVTAQCVQVGNTNQRADNCSVVGMTLHSATAGIKYQLADQFRAQFNRVYSTARYSIGAGAGVEAEPRAIIADNWVTDLGFLWATGDQQAIITNPGNDDTVIARNVLQRIGVRFPVGWEQPLSALTGNNWVDAVVNDVTMRMLVVGNWIEDVAGDAFSNCSPTSSNRDSNCSTIAMGNIIVQRDKTAPATTLAVGKAVGSVLIVAGTDRIADLVMTHNLVVLGAAVQPPVSQDDGLIYVRAVDVAAASAGGRVYSRNNIVVFAEPGWDLPVYVTRRYSTNAAVVQSIDSDYNIFAAASGAQPAAGYRHIADWRVPGTVTKEVAFGAITAGWTDGISGAIINDGNSRIVSLSELAAVLEADGTPVGDGLAYQIVQRVKYLQGYYGVVAAVPRCGPL